MPEIALQEFGKDSIRVQCADVLIHTEVDAPDVHIVLTPDQMASLRAAIAKGVEMTDAGCQMTNDRIDELESVVAGLTIGGAEPGQSWIEEEVMALVDAFRAERDENARLTSLLQEARDKLVEYAEHDTWAGLENSGVFSEPDEFIKDVVDRINLAVGGEANNA